MDVREKLVELIKEGIRKGLRAGGDDRLDYSFEDVADYLIVNGVTVQEWIPVKDRLPRDGRYLTVRYDQVTRSSFVDILWFERCDWWNRHYPGDYDVTHWTPLPQPPKGE